LAVENQTASTTVLEPVLDQVQVVDTDREMVPVEERTVVLLVPVAQQVQDLVAGEQVQAQVEARKYVYVR
jgi:hypothetical protein